jgi:putative transposase
MRKDPFANGEYYHLYNRGVEKRLIFIDEMDKQRLIKLLYFCNSTKPVNLSNLPSGLTFEQGAGRRGETLVSIGAYCLMPNHFHLLIKVKEDLNVALFMQKLMTAYSMYFNIKNQRKGRLFESTYQSRHADSDEYLKYLFSYIHLNPVKLIDPDWKEMGSRDVDKTERYLDNYPYSSYLDYIASGRDQGLILQKDVFPAYFGGELGIRSEIRDWLKYEG